MTLTKGNNALRTKIAEQDAKIMQLENQINCVREELQQLKRQLEKNEVEDENQGMKDNEVMNDNFETNYVI